MDSTITNLEALINIEAEIAILGAIILDEKVIEVCKNKGLQEKDFQGDGYGILYRTMLDLQKNNKPVEILSIVDEIKKIGLKIDVSFLADMTNRTIPSNAQYYISQIKEKAFKRAVYDKMLEFINSIGSIDNVEIKSKLEEIERSLDVNNEIESLFVDASEIKRTDLSSGLFTGFTELDKVTSGLVYGSLTILTGEPSSGKSTLLNQIIAYNLKEQKRAMIYSGELTGFNVLQWFMRTVANIEDLQELSSKVGSYYDVSNDGEFAIREWIKNKLYVYAEDSVASIDNICNTIEYLARNKNVKLFVIDNMMTIENSGKEELEKQKELAKRLKQIARKHKVCVILVAHPKKKQNAERNKYHMHDVSGASEVVNLADYELLLTRDIKIDGSGNRTDETHIAVMKNRITGKQGIKMLLNFDMTRKRFWTNKKELQQDYKYREIEQVNFVEVNEVSEEVPF